MGTDKPRRVTPVTLPGEANPNWRGGRSMHSAGYVKVRMHGHPRADAASYVLEHLIVVERALGRVLPVTARVHHVNEIKSDNRPKNLVACQDHAYHMLIHQRQRSMSACGDPDGVKCWICGEYGRPDTDDIYVLPNNRAAYHRQCRRDRRARVEAA